MYNSNEFLHSAGVSRHMQATGETPSQKTSMKRRSCEVPLGDISSNNFKISLGDITNENNYDCRSLRSLNTEDTQSLRYYRPIDSRSVKNFRSSLADVSAVSTFSLSRPPSYDQLSRRSFIEGSEAQGITSSIEGVLWSDEEENEYFYHENITSAWNEASTSNSNGNDDNPWLTTLFKVPNELQRAKKWLRAVDRFEYLNKIVTKKTNLFVCVKHFKETDLVRVQQRMKHGEFELRRLVGLKLRLNAVPTENLPIKLTTGPNIQRLSSNPNIFNRLEEQKAKLILTAIETIDIPPDPAFSASSNHNISALNPSKNPNVLQTYVDSPIPGIITSPTTNPHVIQAYVETRPLPGSTTQPNTAPSIITPIYILPPAKPPPVKFAPNIPLSSAIATTPATMTMGSPEREMGVLKEEDVESDLVLSITSEQPVDELQSVIKSLCNK